MVYLGSFDINTGYHNIARNRFAPKLTVYSQKRSASENLEILFLNRLEFLQCFII